MSKPKTSDVVRTNIALPAELHRRLRMRALETGTTLLAIIVEAAESWLKDSDATTLESDIQLMAYAARARELRGAGLDASARGARPPRRLRRS